MSYVLWWFILITAFICYPPLLIKITRKAWNFYRFLGILTALLSIGIGLLVSGVFLLSFVFAQPPHIYYEDTNYIITREAVSTNYMKLCEKDGIFERRLCNIECAYFPYYAPITYTQLEECKDLGAVFVTATCRSEKDQQLYTTNAIGLINVDLYEKNLDSIRHLELSRLRNSTNYNVHCNLFNSEYNEQNIEVYYNTVNKEIVYELHDSFVKTDTLSTNTNRKIIALLQRAPIAYQKLSDKNKAEKINATIEANNRELINLYVDDIADIPKPYRHLIYYLFKNSDKNKYGK